MIRSIWTLACCVMFFVVATHAQEHHPCDPHIRSADAALVGALGAGARASATLRELMVHINASDVVVYLVARRALSPTVAAHVSFISKAGGRRYLYVAVDPRYSGCQLVALLGHELQHVVEIADEPSVFDQRSLAVFYRRIGFSTGGWENDRFESQRAVDAGYRVMREMLAPAPAASRGQ
jgi:hypothetical protein